MPRRFRPILGITMGNPAGVGPEITIRALSLKTIYSLCRPLVIGDVEILTRDKRTYGLAPAIRTVNSVPDAFFIHGTIDILDLDNVVVEEIGMGKVQPAAGKASYEYIKKGVELAVNGEIHGIVTAPISKEALNQAGYPFPGHTEILAQLTSSKDFAMMFLTPHLRTILVTIHHPLREACELVKRERILRTIKLAQRAMNDLGISKPRIAVAGLNPHAGESGMFGKEEIEEIIPAIGLARKTGLNVVGPIAPDTAFWRAKKGDFDIVVAMYHDQGCIPIKLLGFEVGVNVTVGLPITRTSVDHGTAFGHARKKLGANPRSMVEAIKVGTKLARQKFGATGSQT